MYQTDFEGFTKKNGCLLFCLIKLAEEKVCKEMPHSQIKEFINVLHNNIFTHYNKTIPVLSNEDDISKPGVFVWDHAAVVNRAMLFLGILDMKCEYIGRIYMPYETARGKKSFGSHEGDAMIFQIRTAIGGHFRMLDYDPWQPGTDAYYLKSTRHYEFYKG